MAENLRYYDIADREYKETSTEQRFPVEVGGDSLPPINHRSYDSGWVVAPGVGISVLYTTADAVGTLIEFPNCVRADKRSGILHSVSMLDMSKTASAAFDIVFFADSVTATADNAAFDPSDDDAKRAYLFVISFATTDFYAFNDWSAGSKANIGRMFTVVGTSLYAQIVARSAPTAAATDDFRVRINVMQD